MHEIGSYSEFWSQYLRAHRRPQTRALHYLGSVLVIVALVGAAVFRDWHALVAAPVIGYGFAWGAHWFVEGNQPQSFGHPLWSLLSDYRMLVLWLSLRLAPHLARAEAAR
jgi:hypothetical protein